LSGARRRSVSRSKKLGLTAYGYFSVAPLSVPGAAAFGSNVAGFDFSPARYEPEQSIPDKIRQRLQVLRDLNLLEFLGSGSYGLH
jgi:hypothetical protein